MVDQMIEDESPDHGRARHGEERLSSMEQRPRLGHRFILCRQQRLAGRRDVPVKQVENFLARCQP